MITDEQINALCERAGLNGNHLLVDDCLLALGQWELFWRLPDAPEDVRRAWQANARARIVGILSGAVL